MKVNLSLKGIPKTIEIEDAESLGFAEGGWLIINRKERIEYFPAEAVLQVIEFKDV